MLTRRQTGTTTGEPERALYHLLFAVYKSCTLFTENTVASYATMIQIRSESNVLHHQFEAPVISLIQSEAWCSCLFDVVQVSVKSENLVHIFAAL